MTEVNKMIPVEEHIDEQDLPNTAHNRNQRLYIASAHLMAAAKEIAPMNADFAKTFYDLGDVLLSEMTVNDKMTKEEMNKVMEDILNG